MKMEDENAVKFKLFDGTNFPHWKFRIGVLLDEYDLKAYIEKDYSDVIATETDATIIEKHRQKDRKCKSMIIKRIADSQLEYIKDKESAKEVFDALVHVFERKSISSQIFLRKKLLALRYDGVGDMKAFFLMFDNLVRELKSTGAKIEDLDVIIHLLLTMPDRFDHVVTVLESANPNKLTMETVKGRLLDHANKIESKSATVSETDSVAMNVKSKVKCYRCGRTGHMKPDCKVKLKGKSKTNGESAQTANSASTSSSKCEREVAFSAHCVEGNSSRTNFIIDSGSSDHLVNSDKYFYESIVLAKPVEISVAKDGESLYATKIGNIRGYTDVNGERQLRVIKNVLFVQNLKHNLFSIRRLEDAGFKIGFDGGKVNISDGNNIVAQGSRVSNLYELIFDVCINATANVCTQNNELDLWHRRLGHLNISDTIKLGNSNVVTGMPNLDRKGSSLCEPCLRGKQTRLPFHEFEGARSSRPLELIHTDVVGPITPAAHDGKRFMVTFIDDRTHFSVVYIIERKSEVFGLFKEYMAMATTHFERKMARIRFDNGGEYISNEFKAFCRDNGIRMEYTVPETPEQNGVAERFNRTLLDKARSMVEESNLPKSFWSEALLTANYVTNRSPTRALKSDRNCTPAELWFGSKPNVSKLRVFGCAAFSHIPKSKRRKMDARSKKCIMVGYATNGYRLYDISAKKIFISRDIVFDESSMPDLSIAGASSEENILVSELSSLEREENTGDVSDHREEFENQEEPIDTQARERAPTADNEPMAPRRGSRNRIPTNFYGVNNFCSINVDAMSAERIIDDLPSTIQEARARPDWPEWKRAVEEELKSMEHNKTWILTALPKGRNLVDNKWVFKIKRNESGEVTRYKARLVARGFSQRKGFDYNETYAPVARLTSLRIIFAIAVHDGMHIHQMDVKTAFLNGSLTEDIYMKQPDGFAKGDLVCKLQRSIYGLRQSARQWYERFDIFIMSLGFVRTTSDKCLYVRIIGMSRIYCLIYVDDAILVGDDPTAICEIKRKFTDEFEMNDVGELKTFLGMRVNFDIELGVLKLSQERYLKNLLDRFGMAECKSIGTPMETDLRLVKEKGGVLNQPYRELIGCLLYITTTCRPDLCAAVNYFSSFQSEPNETHWIHLKRVLRYIRGSLTASLVYKRNPDSRLLEGFADASFGNDIDRKSVSGYLFKVFGCTVSWASRKQQSVALSSTEAELVALCNAACEVIWLKRLLAELGFENDEPVTIYEDNQACIHISENEKDFGRMKHIDIKYYFVREAIESDIIRLEYIRTNEQQADILTKGLAKQQFNILKEAVGISSC